MIREGPAGLRRKSHGPTLCRGAVGPARESGRCPRERRPRVGQPGAARTRWTPTGVKPVGPTGRQAGGPYPGGGGRAGSAHVKTRVRALPLIERGVEPVLDRKERQLDAIRYAQPVEHLRQVIFDRLRADGELRRNVVVRRPGDNSRHDLQLTRRQAKGRLRSGGARRRGRTRMLSMMFPTHSRPTPGSCPAMTV